MTNRRFEWRDALLLLLILISMPFANGRWSIAPAAWIGPALLVRFLRTQPLHRAWLGGLLALSVANYVWWLGVFPLSGVTYALASIPFGLITLVPFLLDRRFALRIGGIAGTLVLPSVVVAVEILHSLGSPFGSWGSYAYSQAGVLPLLQILSVTGLAGVTFLVLWFATIVNAPATTRRRGAILYACVLGAVLAFGVWRLASEDATDTVRVATVTPRIPTYTLRGESENVAVREALSGVFQRRTLPPSQWESFRRRAAEINEQLFQATALEASRGAKIVIWSEGAGIVAKEDEPALIARGVEFARRTGAWIELSFLTIDRGASTYGNQNVLVNPSGNAAWTYHKAHPVPGMEACAPGNGSVPTAQTPYGRVATVICFDSDFPRLVRQAGVAGADILLIPADDWREIASLHSTMATFRSIEQGLSVVRATSNGVSIAVDRFGRVRQKRDSSTGSRTMSAEVPHAGHPTLYSHLGDFAAWLATAAAVVLITAGSLLSQR